MKNVFRSMHSGLATMFIIGITALLLALAPWIYGPVISYFAMLDQYTLFNSFLLVGLLGLIFYVSIEAKKNLHIPYSISAMIFGVSGFTLWNTLIDINPNLYLVLGVSATCFILLRQGLLVETSKLGRVFWKDVFVGVVTSVVLFMLTNTLISSVFPELSEPLRYSASAIMLMLGSHVNSKSLSQMGTVRFAYDMTLLVILYNFVLFSSRFSPDSLVMIFKHPSLYSSAIISTVYGVLIGLIGAYLLHRHHRMWTLAGEEKKENLYTITLLAGMLALAFFVGANPFIAAGIMGLLVNIRDAKSDPESHILAKVESFVSIIVFLIIGASVSYAALMALSSFGAVVTLFVTIFAMLVISLVFYIFGKFGLLPQARIKTYMMEVYNRFDSTLLIGGLALFSFAYLKKEFMLMATLVVVFVVVVEYLYPWVLRITQKEL